jgi:hypothetical protein
MDIWPIISNNKDRRSLLAEGATTRAYMSRKVSRAGGAGAGDNEPLLSGKSSGTSRSSSKSGLSRRKKAKELSKSLMHQIISKRGSQLWKDASYNNEEQFTCMRYTACVSSKDTHCALRSRANYSTRFFI